MTTPRRVAVVVGSLRKDSFNRKMAKALAAIASESLSLEIVETVSWAAKNGDRSENGDYLYGKKRLREIDRRIHFLNKRLDSAEVVDPVRRGDSDQIFFGATVTYAYIRGGREERIITIVGVDEVDVKRGQVSWLSPIARVLLKKRSGDVVILATPAGEAEIEIIGVRYRAPA